MSLASGEKAPLSQPLTVDIGDSHDQHPHTHHHNNHLFVTTATAVNDVSDGKAAAISRGPSTGGGYHHLNNNIVAGGNNNDEGGGDNDNDVRDIDDGDDDNVDDCDDDEGRSGGGGGSGSLGPLPPKWEKAYTDNGEVYFIDHSTGTSHWLDPRLSKFQKKSLEDCLDDELPYGWEKISDPHYGTYFIDHVNRRTQYENPVIQAKRAQQQQVKPQPPPPINGQLPPPPIQQQHHHHQQQRQGTPTGVGSSSAALLFTRDPGELCGRRLHTALVKSSRGLGFTIVGGDDHDDEFLQIKSVVPQGPAWMDGQLQTGDVIVFVNDACVLGYTHTQIVRMFQSIGVGATVRLEVCRGYPLPFDPNDPNTEVVTTIAVDTLSSATDVGGDNDDASESKGLVDNNYNFVNGDADDDARLMSPSSGVDDKSMIGGGQDIGPISGSSGLGGGQVGGDQSAGVVDVQVRIVKGALGFGFTIADSACGQRVKKILDRQRCKNLLEGDILTAINDVRLEAMCHDDVVQVLKNCPYNSEATISVQRTVPLTNSSGGGCVVKSTSLLMGGGGRIHGGVKSALQRNKHHHQLQQQQQLQLQHDGSVTMTTGVGSGVKELINAFRSKTPTADIYSTQTREILPSRPKTPVIDTRHISNSIGTGKNKDFNSNSGVIRDLYGSQDRGLLRLSLIDNGDDVDDDDVDPDLDVDVDLLDAQSEDAHMHSVRGGGGQMKHNLHGHGVGHHAHLPPSQQQQQQHHHTAYGSMPSPQSQGPPLFGQQYHLHHLPPPMQQPHHHVTDMPHAHHGGMQPNMQQQHQHHSAPLATQMLLTQQHYQQRKYAQFPPHRYDCQCFVCATSTTPPPLPPTSSVSSQSSSAYENGTNGGHLPSLQHQHLLKMNNSAMGSSSNGWWSNGSPLSSAAGAMGVDMTVVLHRQETGFGFRIVGGIEDRSQVAVGHIVPGGAADLDGRIQSGDEILSVDGFGVVRAAHRQVVQLMNSAATRGHVTLVLRRRTGPPTISSSSSGGVVLSPGAGYMSPSVAGGLIHTAPAPQPPPLPVNMLQQQAVAVGSTGSGGSIGGASNQSGGGLYGPVNNNLQMYGAHGQTNIGTGSSGGGTYDVTVTRTENEGFGFVIISSVNKVGSTIGRLIEDSPVERCGRLRVGDYIVAVNHIDIMHLTHGDIVNLIKESGLSVTLTIANGD